MEEAVQAAAEERLFEASDPSDLLAELDRIQKDPATKLEEEAASLIAEIALMAEDLAKAGVSKAVFQQAIIAARAAAAGGSNLIIAQDIVEGLRDGLGPDAPPSLVLRGMLRSALLVAAIAVVVGLIYVIGGLGTSGLANFGGALNTVWTGALSNIIILSGIFGLFGGTVSVLSSLNGYDGQRRSRHYFYFAGAVLPIVGSVFAIVIAALFASGVITSSMVPTVSPAMQFFYCVLGFAAGFSERFARGLLDTFESKAGENGDDAQ